MRIVCANHHHQVSAEFGGAMMMIADDRDRSQCIQKATQNAAIEFRVGRRRLRSIELIDNILVF